MYSLQNNFLNFISSIKTFYKIRSEANEIIQHLKKEKIDNQEFISQYKLEEDRFKVAENCFQKDIRQTIEKIEFFMITSEERRFELVKNFLKKDFFWTFKHIQKFNLKEEYLFEIIKPLAENEENENIFSYARNLGIQKEEYLFELAKICALKKGSSYILDFIKLGIQKEDYVFELAKILALKLESCIYYFIRNLKFKNEKYLFEIAKILAQHDPAFFFNFLEDPQKLGIQKEEYLFELAKIWVLEKAFSVPDHIKKMGTKGMHLFDAAPIWKDNIHSFVKTNLFKFGIEKEEYWFKLVKIFAEKGEKEIIFYMNNFGIQKEQYLFEIAKIYAKTTVDFDEVLKIKCLGIQKKEYLFEIGKIIIQNPGDFFTLTYIQQLGIHEKKDLFELAKIFAQTDFFTTCVLRTAILDFLNRFFKVFKINEEEKTLEIFFLAIKQDPINFYNFVHFKIADEETNKLFSFLSSWKGEEQEFTKAIQVLSYYLEKKYKEDLGFKNLLMDPDFTKIKDLHAKKNLIDWLGQVFFILRKSLENEELKWIKEEGFLEGFFSLKHPFIRLPFTFFLSTTSKKVQNKFEKIPPTRFEKYRFGKLFRFVLAKFITSGFNEELVYTFLLKFNSIKDFKDDKKFVILIDMLRLLENEKILTLSEKEKILKKLIFIEKNKVVENVNALHNLFKLGFVSNLKESHFSFVELFQKVFQEIVPLPSIENLSLKLFQTFDQCRDPLSFYTYAFKLKTLKNEEVMQQFANFTKSVLEGTFQKERNSLKNNPHLQKVFKNPFLKEKWEKSSKILLSALNLQDKKKEFFFLNFLKEKLLIDSHLELKLYPLLQKFLELSHEEERDMLISSLKENTTFEQKCLFLWKNWEKEEFRMGALKEIQELLLQSNSKKIPEFYNDLKGLIQNFSLHKKELEIAYVIDTENPYDLLLSGTEVNGSCQRIDGDPNLNVGLLGYLLDGKIRLIAVKNKQGKILARAILRILWDGKNPVLFLDRTYPTPCPASYEEAILEMAKRKANELGLSLLAINKDQNPSQIRLYSFEGPALFEYCDGASGLQKNGKYTIENCQFILDRSHESNSSSFFYSPWPSFWNKFFNNS